MANQVHYVPAGSGPAVWGAGDTYTFLVTGEESGGSYFTMHVRVPPGGGPPPHIHHGEEEQFYILAGEVTIQVGGQPIQAAVGDFVHVPQGTIHAFQNTGEAPVEMLVTYSPAGIEGLFRQAFVPVDDPTADPPPWTEDDFWRFKAIEAEFGLETVLPGD